MTHQVSVQIAQIVPCTEAEGPGKRFAVWFQGCPLRCPGCCNPEFLSFQGGETIALDELLRGLEQSVREHRIEGISLLGGEPFAHARPAAELAKAAHIRGLSVMVYSGFTLAEIRGL